jgi:hypothetical protein
VHVCVVYSGSEFGGVADFGGATQIDSEYSAFLEAFEGVGFGEE